MPMRRRPRRLLIPALFSALCAGGCLVPCLALWFAPDAAAQEVVQTPQYRSNRPYESEVEAANPPPSRFHVTGGIDVRDSYFFRGYNHDPSGFILQPYFQLLYTVYQDEHVAITPHAGAWFDISETKGPENPKHFNEFRPSGGVLVDTGGFTFDVQYVMYKSPSELFQRSEEIGIDVRYNDRVLWPKSSPVAAINPAVSYYWEFDDNKDGERNSFIGVGIDPELQPVRFGKVPVTISFPASLGASWDGYYFNDRGGTQQVGYWMAGIKAAVDLPSSRNSPKCRLEAELDYIRMLADSTKRANGGDNDDFTFRFGFAFQL